ncbi:hypothetical protein GCM10009722_34600 [Williamsia deligens]|nr:hypothetical protein [Williamsia deligens]
MALTGVDVHLGVAGYAGTAARVTWKVTTPLPTNGTVLLSLLAASQDGSTTRQLGWKTQNGQQVSYFVFESYTQRSLDGYPDTRVPNEVSGVLPSGDVEALGDNWHWSATLNVDGEDVAACPG